jgi:hypothetical protein
MGSPASNGIGSHQLHRQQHRDGDVLQREFLGVMNSCELQVRGAEHRLTHRWTSRCIPNPTGGELNVDLTQYIGRSVRIETYSLEGKLLQFNELDEVQTTLERLDLKGFQNGMYLVKVKSAGLPDVTKRVVVTR